MVSECAELKTQLSLWSEFTNRIMAYISTGN